MDQSKGGKAVTILSYSLLVMTLTHVLTHVFGGIHTAVFSVLRDEFSLTLQQLGFIAAIPPLCQALLAIPTGLLSDRIGSKKMIAISFVVATLGALLASQAVNPIMFIVAICLVYVNTTIYPPPRTVIQRNYSRQKTYPRHWEYTAQVEHWVTHWGPYWSASSSGS
jgi:MFS family permease